MAKRKIVKIEATIPEAFENARGEVDCLMEEMNEWRDNMEEKLSHTDKYEQVSECADALENISSNLSDLELPEEFAGIKTEYSYYKPYSRTESRATRAGAACAALECVKEVLDGKIAELEEKELEAVLSKEDEDRLEALIEMCDTINEQTGELENVEFPGMFG